MNQLIFWNIERQNSNFTITSCVFFLPSLAANLVSLFWRLTNTLARQPRGPSNRLRRERSLVVPSKVVLIVPNHSPCPLRVSPVEWKRLPRTSVAARSLTPACPLFNFTIAFPLWKLTNWMRRVQLYDPPFPVRKHVFGKPHSNFTIVFPLTGTAIVKLKCSLNKNKSIFSKRIVQLYDWASF